MRTTTCAYDAAGKKVRASNAAIAIFFTIDHSLHGLMCRCLQLPGRLNHTNAQQRE
jgi:hypothetical protein